MTANYPFRFFRMGGVDQVALETSDDIRHLKELDIKLWMAVAMPTKGIALDPRMLRLLDENDDGRILVPDILRTIEWLEARLNSLAGLFTDTDEIALDDIADEALRTNTAKMLGDGETSITLEKLSAIRERFQSGTENGDGIITADIARSDEEKALIEAIVAAQGSAEDRSGDPGINKEKVEAYFGDAKALFAWRKKGQSEEIRPFGDGTDSLAALLRELGPKLDDYFTRSRVAAFDPRAVDASHGGDDDFAAIVKMPLSLDSDELKKLTIARIAPNAPLDFEIGVNPAYGAALARFRDEIARPILGATTRKLDEAGLQKIRERFAAFESYLGEKPETKLDALSDADLETLPNNGQQAGLEELIEADLSRKDEFDRIDELESLMVLHRDFIHVLRNFVNFSEFYMRKQPIFQAGTLYLDGRACELSILVDDPATHMGLANLAGSYLAYCELKRKDEEPRKIVAAFTAGSSDNLRVARNGVFIDREGRYWDATITLVVENPISLRQAFFSPYKRFARLIEEQVSKRASAAEAESQSKIESAAERTANADQVEAAASPPKKRGVDVGTVAAIGVAVGGIGAMVTGLVSTFLGLGLFMPFGILAIILAISLPSVVLAYVKLRRRNLGPLLDASGWAVNGFAAINMPFGRVLTKTAALPKGASRKVVDPYAQSRRPFWFSVAAFIILSLGVSWGTKRLDPYLPEVVQAESVFAALKAKSEEGEDEETAAEEAPAEE